MGKFATVTRFSFQKYTSRSSYMSSTLCRESFEQERETNEQYKKFHTICIARITHLHHKKTRTKMALVYSPQYATTKDAKEHTVLEEITGLTVRFARKEWKCVAVDATTAAIVQLGVALPKVVLDKIGSPENCKILYQNQTPEELLQLLAKADTSTGAVVAVRDKKFMLPAMLLVEAANAANENKKQLRLAEWRAQREERNLAAWEAHERYDREWRARILAMGSVEGIVGSAGSAGPTMQTASAAQILSTSKEDDIKVVQAGAVSATNALVQNALVQNALVQNALVQNALAQNAPAVQTSSKEGDIKIGVVARADANTAATEPMTSVTAPIAVAAPAPVAAK